MILATMIGVCYEAFLRSNHVAFWSQVPTDGATSSTVANVHTPHSLRLRFPKDESYSQHVTPFLKRLTPSPYNVSPLHQVLGHVGPSNSNSNSNHGGGGHRSHSKHGGGGHHNSPAAGVASPPDSVASTEPQGAANYTRFSHTLRLCPPPPWNRKDMSNCISKVKHYLYCSLYCYERHIQDFYGNRNISHVILDHGM